MFGGRRIFSLFRIAVWRLVELRVHSRGYALGFQRGLEFGAHVRVFLVIGDGGAALLEVDSAEICQLLARSARLALRMIVDAEPGGKAQWLLADAEMLVEPIARHGRRRDQADRLV